MIDFRSKPWEQFKRFARLWLIACWHPHPMAGGRLNIDVYFDYARSCWREANNLPAPMYFSEPDQP